MIPGRTFTKEGYYQPTDGVLHTGSPAIIQTNSSFKKYWGRELPFANIIQHSQMTGWEAAVPGTINSDTGYVDASISGNVQFELATGLPPGRYVLRWLPATLSVNWQGRTPDVVAAGREEYVLTERGDQSTRDRLTYSGGEPTEFICCLLEDEARIDAGKVVSSNYLRDMEGVQVWRSMNFTGTNNSQIRDYTDFISYNNWSSAFDIRDGWQREDTQYGPKIIAQFANEINAHNIAQGFSGTGLWYCAPHQATDACLTSIFQEINTYIDLGIDVWVELSNEIWNPGQSWRDGWEFYKNEDAPLHENNTFDPVTVTCTETAHGLTWGDEIACYNNRTYSSSNPSAFVRGSIKYVMVDDANTWRGSNFAAPIENATRANPCVLTLTGRYDSAIAESSTIEIDGVVEMTELNGNSYTATNISYEAGADTTSVTLSGIDSTGYTTFVTPGGYAMQLSTSTINTNLTKLRYHKRADSNAVNGVNFARRTVETWDIAETELPNNNVIKVLATWYGVPFRNGEMFGAVPRAREDMDYLAITCYWFTETSYDWDAHVQGAAGDALALASTIAAYTEPNSNFGGDTQQYTVQEHVESIGHTRIVCYEGGAAGSGGSTTAIANKISFIRGHYTDSILDAYKGVWSQWVDSGLRMISQYRSHGSDNTGSGATWGAMELGPQDITDAKYRAVKQFYDFGGVWKSPP